MTLQDLARAALSYVSTAVPSVAVTVKAGNQSTTAARYSRDGRADSDEFGERGFHVGVLTVNAANLIAPTLGSTITIDNDKAIVTAVSTDSAGAFHRIEYQETQPVEGV